MKEKATDFSGIYDGEMGNGKRTTVVKDDVWRDSKVMHDFLRRSPIAQALAECMSSQTARIYEDLLIYKESAETSPTPWHQDEPQWPVTGRQLSSAWLSLDETTPETGALCIVAGSHNGPIYVPYVPAAMQPQLEEDMHFFTGGKLPEINAQSGHKIISFSTHPGDVILFHPRVIHAAYGSSSTRPRRTFSIRMLGDDVRWQPKATVVYDWLRNIPLKPGDPVSGERFPRFWPSGVENSMS
jgi:ectoine hydroxylase-related dioxygenase (phytanoyl-CoA dioxygenase family)